jgi:nucleoside-diphosphate-sugar epimerase
MKILITGKKGFVGSETTRLLEEKGHEVIGYDIMDGFDIRDKEQLRNVLSRKNEQKYWDKLGSARIAQPIDRVLHLAAIARFADADKNPRLTYETNMTGTKNVAEVCAELHIPLVYSSTGSVYMPIVEEPPITEEFRGMGNSVYGCSKYIGETFVREHTPHIILRYGHIYGKEKRGHGLIGGYWARIQRGLKPMLYGGDQSNDFVYIKDIAQANWRALTATWDKWNQVYNIGSGEELTAEQAGEIVCRVTGWKGGVEKKEARTVDAARFFYDPTKAEVMLGYKPEYSFERGITEMFADITEDQKKDDNGHSTI